MMDEGSSDEEVFVTQICFSQGILEPKSYADCILNEIEDIAKFDTANLCAEDLNKKVVDQNVQEKLIESCEASRVRRNMCALKGQRSVMK